MPESGQCWYDEVDVTAEFPAQRRATRKMFPFDDVIMFIAKSWLNDLEYILNI